MSLLTICQNAAAYVPLAAPTTIIGNSDSTAAFLLQCAQRAGKRVSRVPQFGWIAQQVEHLFETVSLDPLTGTIANSGAGGVAVITGLSSTASITALTFGASGTGIPLNAVVASVDSATQVTLNMAATATGSGVAVTFSQFAYAVPADFAGVIDNSLWDRSRYWQMRGPYSPQEWQRVKSSILTQATIQRRVRFEYIAGSQYMLIQPIPTDDGSLLVYEYVSTYWCKSSGGVGRVQWAADTDVGIVDEYLIELDLGWRLLRRQGMDYSEEREEFERELDKLVARDGGAAPLSLAQGRGDMWLGGYANVPEGSFPST